MTKRKIVVILTMVILLGGVSFFVWMKVSGRVMLPRIVSNLFIMWNFHPPVIESISTLEENQILTLLNGMKKDLFSIAEVDSVNFGMGSNSSVEKTTFGKPFQVYSLTSERATSIKTDSELLLALVPSQDFYVPINWGSGNGALVTVQRIKDGFKFTGVGGSGTLTKLGKALSACNTDTEVLWKTNNNNPQNFYFVVTSGRFTGLSQLLLVNGHGLIGVSLAAITKDGSGVVTPAVTLVRSVFELP